MFSKYNYQFVVNLKDTEQIEDRFSDRFYILTVEVHSVIGLLMVHTKSCSVGGTLRCAHQVLVSSCSWITSSESNMNFHEVRSLP